MLLWLNLAWSKTLFGSKKDWSMLKSKVFDSNENYSPHIKDKLSGAGKDWNQMFLLITFLTSICWQIQLEAIFQSINNFQIWHANTNQWWFLKNCLSRKQTQVFWVPLLKVLSFVPRQMQIISSSVGWFLLNYFWRVSVETVTYVTARSSVWSALVDTWHGLHERILKIGLLIKK